MGDEHSSARGKTSPRHGIVDRHRDDVPDPTLRVRDGKPERELRQPFDGGMRGDELAAAKDEAHLGAVAMTHDHGPVRSNELGYLFGKHGRTLLLAGY